MYVGGTKLFESLENEDFPEAQKSIAGEGLVRILKEISDDCYFRKHCAGCKFDKNGECILKGIPCDWDLEDINETCN